MNEAIGTEAERPRGGADAKARPADAENGGGDVEPQKVYVELTTDCDLDCAMCLRRSWDSPGGTMSAETFERVVAQSAELPTLGTMNLSGYGEPTAHPQFARLAERAKQAGLAVEVVTNALSLDAGAAERLIDLALDKLIVSVDGRGASSSAALHAGTFDRVAANLRRFYRLRLARNASKPEVGLEFVATKRNVHELPGLVALSRVLGFAGVLVTNLIARTPAQWGEVLYERPVTACRQRPQSPWNPVVDLPLVDATSEASGVVERLRAGGLHLRANGTDVAGAGPRCRFVTEGRLAVRWDGQVSPCLSLLHTHQYYFRGRRKRVVCYHVGNVHDDSLGALWHAAAFRAFRDRVRRFAFSPCIDCGGCDLRDTNEQDCTGESFPRCGECLWAAGLVQCP